MNELLTEIRTFVESRDWAQFHSPKNLAEALTIETSEILEIFLWMKEKDSYDLPDDKLNALKEEIGDVQVYLLMLADKFNLDPIRCAKDKMKKNAEKYPADLVRGKSKKYDEY